jgi:hypothetical protein
MQTITISLRQSYSPLAFMESGYLVYKLFPLPIKPREIDLEGDFVCTSYDIIATPVVRSLCIGCEFPYREILRPTGQNALAPPGCLVHV